MYLLLGDVFEFPLRLDADSMASHRALSPGPIPVSSTRPPDRHRHREIAASPITRPPNHPELQTGGVDSTTGRPSIPWSKLIGSAVRNSSLPLLSQDPKQMSTLHRHLRTCLLHLTRQPFTGILDTFFVFFAAWTLVWNAIYFSGGDLSFTRYILPPLLLLSPLVLLLKPKNAPELEATAHQPVIKQRLLIISLVALAVILTLCLHRPDADDQHFLSWTFSLVSNAHQPANAVPGYQSDDRAVVGYEPLRAALAYVTGTPLLYWYYLITPSIIAALAVIANWAMLQQLVGRYWPVGILFFFVVMLAWGDVHRTHANFGFVRFFQGKSALVNLVVPAIFFYFFRFYQESDKRYYVIMLAAVLISGIGFSRGGIVIGPLLLGLLLLVSMQPGHVRTTLRIAFVILAVCLPLAWLLRDQIGTSNSVYTAQGYVESTTNEEMYHFIPGDGFRAYLILFLTGLSVYAVTNQTIRPVYHRLMLVFFILLAVPWTSNFFGKYVHVYLSWRWLWAIPFPVMAAAAVAGLYRCASERTGRLSGSFAVAAILSGFVLVSPKWVLSEHNYTELGWPRFKLPSDSIHLDHFGQDATVMNGRLYLEGSSEGF